MSEKLGPAVGKPLDAYPDRTTYVESDDLARVEVFEKLRREIRAGAYAYFHVGIPRGPFSALRNLWVGTRSAQCPQGDVTRTDARVGNLLVERTCVVCRGLYRAGGFFSIEHEASAAPRKYR